MNQSHSLISDSYWVIPGRFMAGEYPGHYLEQRAMEKLRWLVSNGIDYFFDLTESEEYNLIPYAPLLQVLVGENHSTIQHQRLAIPDMDIPTNAGMLRILDTIDSSLENDRNIYLHCYGGIGRTGTVVGCYLVRHGMPGRDALDQIARWRRDTPDGWRRSPETEQQRQMVLNWKG